MTMTNKEKMLAGEVYDANDVHLVAERDKCNSRCFDYNNLCPSDKIAREELLRTILGHVGSSFLIEQPFMCDYGYNITIGENFYSNHNLTILDENSVTFGDNVFIAPNCSFYTAKHPIDVERRNRGDEFAAPIVVGSNVWIGGNVVVLAGVTIGDNSVIGAGSVVVKSIPANCIAVGNPCCVIKHI